MTPNCSIIFSSLNDHIESILRDGLFKNSVIEYMMTLINVQTSSITRSQHTEVCHTFPK